MVLVLLVVSKFVSFALCVNAVSLEHLHATKNTKIGLGKNSPFGKEKGEESVGCVHGFK